MRHVPKLGRPSLPDPGDPGVPMSGQVEAVDPAGSIQWPLYLLINLI